MSDLLGRMMDFNTVHDGRCYCCGSATITSGGCGRCSSRTLCSCGALLSCSCGRAAEHEDCPNTVRVSVPTTTAV